MASSDCKGAKHNVVHTSVEAAAIQRNRCESAECYSLVKGYRLRTLVRLLLCDVPSPETADGGVVLGWQLSV